MKIKFIILLIFSLHFASLAQVSPPQLRCLEIINTNGDVKLTWLPPADPQNVFFGYEVWCSPVLNGTYALVSSGSSPVTTNSFVHTTTVTTAQSLYYFVKSKYGAGGTSTSQGSDTLRTLFLNINTSLSETYQLLYNELRSPNLNSTSPTFTIAREYPPGTWSDVVITPLFTYNDTLSICNTASLIMNYHVSLQDNSGCTSISNLQGGEYHDKHDPYLLNVDSISVLPDGSTIIAWQLPKDKDVVAYEIQRDIQTKYTPIDTLYGYNTKSYLFNTVSANNGTVAVFVKAMDSCWGGSILDYQPVTMYLQTFYNYCTFETEIDWTSYRWNLKNGKPIDEVLAYWVYASEDSGATFTKIGTTTANKFFHKNVATSKPMCYFVRVINKGQSMTASSNRSYFYSGVVNAPAFVYIRTATVIKKNVNEIQIHIDPKKAWRLLEVERSEDNIKYEKIGSISYKAVANYVLVDEKADTENRPFFYRVRVIDSCGNYRLMSNVARTILLTVSEDQENVFQRHLSWTNYVGFDAGVLTYEIYRSLNNLSTYELVGKADTTNYFTDDLEYAAPYGADIAYLVKAIEGPGNQYKIQGYSSSNFAPAYMEGRMFIPNAFAPDGYNKTWKPVTHFIERKEYNVSVYNRWGKLVFETNNNVEAWNGVDCPGDIYTYIVSYKNSRGEYQQVTGHVSLIR